MSKSKLPEKLYAFIENEGTEDEFISTATSVDGITTNEDGSMVVGMYELLRVKNAINKTELFDFPEEGANA